MTTVGRGRTDGYLASTEVSAIVTRRAWPPCRSTAGACSSSFRTARGRCRCRCCSTSSSASWSARRRRSTYLVALGTHAPMSDAELSRLRRPARRRRPRGPSPHLQSPLGRSGHVRPSSARFRPTRSPTLSGGRLRAGRCRVALNRLVVEYDHVLICGPVFPHEVAGFSGGTKYLFPGIAAPRDHPLHALAGRARHELRDHRDARHARARRDRPRGRAARRRRSRSSRSSSRTMASPGAFCRRRRTTPGARPPLLSARRHIAWVDRPFDRMLSIMPPMYDDLWTAAKGVYKAEPGDCRRRRGHRSSRRTSTR